jgi:predicted PurR-regulated permease PerM
VSRALAAGSHLLREGAVRLGDTLLHLALFFMMLFFLLRDGPALGAEIRGVSPFSRAQEEDMLRHLNATVRAGMLALVLVPVAEAATAVVGFAIFGLPAPVLWGAMVGFAGLIPVMGTPLAWVPAGLYLLATGPAWRGIGLLIYGVAVIGMVGHIVKPLVLRGGAQIHPLLGFLAILGGIFAFGPAGLIVGPVILSLTMSALRIYRFDILRWREQPAPIR